jgi:hypothetical protein
MRTLILVTGFVFTLGGCASNAAQKAWGKPGVSKMDYALDVGTCSGFAVTQGSGGGANIAGGVDGKAIANSTNPAPVYTVPAGTDSNGQQTTHVDAPLPTAGGYSGMASADYVQRAVTQQRTQEMTAQRARSEALRSCLVERGYQEFVLTEEQRAHLATLTKGTSEYLEYLHSIGSAPEAFAAQTASQK